MRHITSSTQNLTTFPMLLVPVDVVLELYPRLPVGGLVADERVLEELLRRGPLRVVLDEALLDEVVEFLAPVTVQTICPARCSTRGDYSRR